jgi:hypothetical protein
MLPPKLSSHTPGPDPTSANGKQLRCRHGTALKLLWPAVNMALAGENWAISEIGTGRAPAGSINKLPNSSERGGTHRSIRHWQSPGRFHK